MEIDTLDPNNILLKLQNNIDLVDANGGVCMVAFIFADKPPNRGASVDTGFAITAPDQLHGVPLGQYSCIGEAYEEVLQVEDPFKCPDGVRGFLCIRLQLDARKAIPSRCWLAREEGKPSRVEFYYETQRFHILCFNCGRLGHINYRCKFAPDPHPEMGNRYGGWTFLHPIRQARALITNEPRSPINIDEGYRRWTTGARGSHYL
ncbi:hypothetical protein ACFX2I_002915 [Malus domestica]